MQGNRQSNGTIDCNLSASNLKLKKMKKWNDRLPRVTKLEKQEMKLISGGSRVASGNCCAYNNDWRESGFTCLNYGGSPGGAAFMAGEEG